MTLDEGQKWAAILTPIVALIAAGFAFRAWRNELHGKSRFEVARKVLLGAMKLRDQIRAARSPFMGSEEWAGRPRADNERPEAAHTNDAAFAYFKRLEKVDELHREFRLTSLEAKVFWYVEIPKLVDPISAKVHELYATHRVYFMRPSPPPNVSERDRFESVIYGGGKDDVFGQELDQRVHNLEDFLRQWIGTG